MKICKYTGLQLSKVADRYAVKVENHPAANNRGYILRARYLMEQQIGRYLESYEQVHHIDGDQENDDMTNLRIITTIDKRYNRHLQLRSRGRPRELDYELIGTLRAQGLGYKKIAKLTGYIRESIRFAIKKMGI